MKKTLNINLGGMIFHVDEDAFNKLENYMSVIKQQFEGTTGGHEIINDIETRIAELFKERTTEAKEVVTIEDVDAVIEIMGEPEDYMDEDTRQAQEYSAAKSATRNRRVFRDPDNRVIGGVSSGLAAYFNIDPLWLRLLFLILFFAGPGFLIYIILWIAIPKAKTTAEKLMMQGEPVTISNIGRSVKDEMQDMGGAKRFSSKVRSYDYRAAAERSSDNIGGFFEGLGIFLRRLFSVIFKILGVIFLIIGFLLLFSIVIGLLAGGVQIMGTTGSLQDVENFLGILTVDHNHYLFMMIGLGLTLIAPLFLLVFLGLRLIFNLDPLHPNARNSLILATVAGIVMLAIGGSRLGLAFEDDGEYTSQEKLLNLDSTLVITSAYDTVSERFFNVDDHQGWVYSGKKHYFGDVTLDIRLAPDSVSFLEYEYSSQGRSRREAVSNARDLVYNPTLGSDTLDFPFYYTLKDGAKFRAQELDMILYLAPGHEVYLDKSAIDIIYDIKNLNNYWDGDMVEHHWKMTREGLLCTDCPDSPGSLDETRTYRDGDKEIEMNIKDGEIDLKLKDHIQMEKQMQIEEL